MPETTLVQRKRMHDTLEMEWKPYDPGPGYQFDNHNGVTHVLPIARQEACGCVEVFFPDPPKKMDKDHNWTYPLYCFEHKNWMGLCSAHLIPHPWCHTCNCGNTLKDELSGLNL